MAFLVMQCGREFRSDIAVGLSDYKIVEAPWEVVLKSLGESFTWIFCGAEANAGLSTSLCKGLLVVSGQAATASIVQCRFLVVPGSRRHFTELCWGAVASEGFVFLDKIVDQLTCGRWAVRGDHFVGFYTKPGQVFECTWVVMGCNDGTLLAPRPKAGQQSETQVSDVYGSVGREVKSNAGRGNGSLLRLQMAKISSISVTMVFSSQSFATESSCTNKPWAWSYILRSPKLRFLSPRSSARSRRTLPTSMGSPV